MEKPHSGKTKSQSPTKTPCNQPGIAILTHTHEGPRWGQYLRRGPLACARPRRRGGDHAMTRGGLPVCGNRGSVVYTSAVVYTAFEVALSRGVTGFDSWLDLLASDKLVH